MSNEQEGRELGAEDRLKAVLYQYIKLYERWSDDRQVFIKYLSQLDEFCGKLDKQLKKLCSIENDVRNQVITSIQNEMRGVAEGISKKIEGSAITTIQNTESKLETAVNNAARALDRYEYERTLSHLKVIGIAIISSALSALLIVKLLMPAPIVPLTGRNLKALNGGLELLDIWPYLSRGTKSELGNVAQQHENMDLPAPLSKKDDG